MRLNNKFAIALVAIVGLSLAGCTPVSTSLNASAISCEDVPAKLTAAKEARDQAKAEIKDHQGTAAVKPFSDDLDKAKVDIEALEARADSSECTNESKPTSTPTATPTPTSKPAEEFVIKLPRRDNGRLNADGVAKPGDAEAFRAQIAEQAKHDPVTLFLYYMNSPLGKKKPLDNEATLAKDGLVQDGNTYSAKGEQAYKDWLFLWDLTDINAVSEIKFQGSNTGVSQEGKPVQEATVAGDDKSGYDISYQDATGKVIDEHSALNRCTQPTSGGAVPNTPPGKTDNPTPPPTENTPKNINEAPQRTGNLPEQQMPNPLPASPGDAQPEQPTLPQPVYTPPPAEPAPEPAPVGGEPAPAPEPTPVDTPPVEAPAPQPSAPAEGCAPAPGRPC